MVKLAVLTPAALAFAFVSGEAFGQETATATAARADFIPPRPIGTTTIAHPDAAPSEEVVVTVRLRVDETGSVVNVELVHGAGSPWDEAVIAGVRRFQFEPGTYLGTPVQVDINFTQRFAPKVEDAPAPEHRIPSGVLTGRLREKGTRRPIAGASVIAEHDGVAREATSDDSGIFTLELPEGTSKIIVLSTGRRRFVQSEEISRNIRHEVEYLLESDIYNPYEVVVTAQRDRVEVARTQLRGRDIAQVAGTFGDPFRVIGSLPGVSSIMSLLPFPVVRGSSPGNTGFLIDGVRVPLLFHLLAGPSVIHPEFIDAIEFSPGGFSVDYGGYTGGIVDGKTRSGRPDDKRIDLDLNLFQLGGLVRYPLPLPGGSGTIAARYGFPGLLIGIATPRATLDYWDYQARVDAGDANDRITIFLFGANDALDAVPDGEPDSAPKEPLLHFLFHRIDLRYHQRRESLESSYQVTLGYDGSLTPDADLTSHSAAPRARWMWRTMPELDLRFGIDAQLKSADISGGDEGLGELGRLLGTGGEPRSIYAGGALVEAIIRPTENLVLRPGVRADGYWDTKSTQASIDPRLLARYRMIDVAPELWLKGSVGIYHQPPRFTVPIPGLDEIAFERGLLRTVQVMSGAEARLGGGFSVDAQIYFNWMDPILYDTALNPSTDQVATQPPAAPPGQAPENPPVDPRSLEDRLDQLLIPATGRAYGVEFLIRRESKSGISGWIAYTLSRSERHREGHWAGFDFDRTHILNIVATVPLPRRWQIGARASFESGRPLTTTSGLSTARTSPFVRFDLRIDKTAVWNDWLLDFYVDITNVVLGAEELSPNNTLRYVLPTAGLRAIF